MIPDVKVLERIPRVAPLGVQLWDVATQSVAERGLRVTARMNAVSRVVRAMENPSGVFVLRGLPGLWEAESGEWNQANWASPPGGAFATVEVSDPRGRYLPMSFQAPVPFEGLFEADCAFSGSSGWRPVEGGYSSPGAAHRPVVPLFSAPAREPPSGIAVLRADLEVEGSGAPASWALIEVTIPGRPPALGAADGRGRAAVMFACPEPPGLTLSPPSPGTVPLSDQRWTASVRVYFGAASPPGHGPVASPEGIPDLCALLAQQEVTPLADGTSTLHNDQLRYGRDLVVKTVGHSSLLVVLPGSVPSP